VDRNAVGVPGILDWTKSFWTAHFLSRRTFLPREYDDNILLPIFAHLTLLAQDAMRDPDPQTNRELERLYEAQPRHEQIVRDAVDDASHGEDSPAWTPYKLPEPLWTVWAVTAVQEKTMNGGFEYFFGNDWPDCPPYKIFIDAFVRIGASESADLLRTAAGAFPFQEPHLDCDARREYLLSSRSQPRTEDSLIDRCGQRMMDLCDENYQRLSQYILEHVAYFPTVQQRSQQTGGDEPAPRGST
jgi:hypothetical protein